MRSAVCNCSDCQHASRLGSRHLACHFCKSSEHGWHSGTIFWSCESLHLACMQFGLISSCCPSNKAYCNYVSCLNKHQQSQQRALQLCSKVWSVCEPCLEFSLQQHSQQHAVQQGPITESTSLFQRSVRFWSNKLQHKQSGNVCFDSETTYLHWKIDLRHVWGQ